MSKQSRIFLPIIAALEILTGCIPAAREDLGAPSPVADSGAARALGVTATSATLLLDDARRARASSLVELLNGRVAGLRVERRAGGAIALLLRGNGSALYAEPLVVVDGMPIADGAALADFLATIAPEDVARVDVLRDPSATAIYGPRGADGVVLITLRHRRR